MLALFITITMLKDFEALDRAIDMFNQDTVFGEIAVELFL